MRQKLVNNGSQSTEKPQDWMLFCRCLTCSWAAATEGAHLTVLDITCVLVSKALAKPTSLSLAVPLLASSTLLLCMPVTLQTSSADGCRGKDWRPRAQKASPY